MANGKIVSYIQKSHNIESNITKEENISSKFILSSSINKFFNIISHVTIVNSPTKKAYNLQSYIQIPYILTSDIVSNKDN